MEDTQPVFWFEQLLPMLFVAFWLFISLLVAQISGWGELARVYREPRGMARVPVQSFWMASARMRGGGLPLPSSYQNCLIVQVAAAGLHLRIWPLFRVGHPPIFIPWTHIERLEPRERLFSRTLVIQPRGVDTHIQLYGGAARAVEDVGRQLAARAEHGAVAV